MSTTSAAGVRPSTVRRLSIASLGALTIGIAVGLVWLWLAAPARWEARDTGIVLTEAAARGQFSVVVVFVLAGIVASTAFGWIVAQLLPALGWLLTPVVIVLATLAALVAWRVGVELGPPPPTSVQGLAVGDRVPSQLAVDGIAPFLVWPVFGLVGLIGAVWSRDGRRADDL